MELQKDPEIRRFAPAFYEASRFRIAAQRAAVARFVEADGIEIVAEHTDAEHIDIEPGKGTDAIDRRPQLELDPENETVG